MDERTEVLAELARQRAALVNWFTGVDHMSRSSLMEQPTRPEVKRTVREIDEAMALVQSGFLPEVRDDGLLWWVVGQCEQSTMSNLFRPHERPLLPYWTETTVQELWS